MIGAQRILLALVLVGSLWALAASRAKPAVLLLPSVGRTDEVTVRGRALRGFLSGSSAPARNLSRLATPNWEGAKVSVSFLGQTAEVVSGKDGAFSATFRAPKESPWKEGLHPVEARVKGASQKSVLQLVGAQAPFLVISDFDDTLAQTHVLSRRQMLKASILQDESSQPVVEGMASFFRCLHEEREYLPPFALVSGSPVQFSARIEAFLAKHGFPFMGLHLRNFGPSTLSGYKQPALKELVASVPLPLILVGDSGEKDPEIYAELRRQHPKRVQRIYIRDAGNTRNPKRFADMMLFKEPMMAARDAAARGLALASCVEREFGAP